MEVDTKKFYKQFKEAERLQSLFEEKLIKLCFERGVSINKVHDSMLLDGPKDKVEEVLEIVRGMKGD